MRAPQIPRIKSAARLMAVSGSCSPVTANHIAWAREHGFEPLRVEAVLATDPDPWQAHIAQKIQQALGMIAAGQDPIAYTALGSDDPAIGALRTAVQSAGTNPEVVNEQSRDSSAWRMCTDRHRAHGSRRCALHGAFRTLNRQTARDRA